MTAEEALSAGLWGIAASDERSGDAMRDEKDGL